MVLLTWPALVLVHLVSDPGTDLAGVPAAGGLSLLASCSASAVGTGVVLVVVHLLAESLRFSAYAALAVHAAVIVVRAAIVALLDFVERM